jgi:hypothetical protein
MVANLQQRAVLSTPGQASTKPLDGHDLWAALLSNDPSKTNRTDIYYGISDASVGIYGPALRTADGMKIIMGGWGGGSGQ